MRTRGAAAVVLSALALGGCPTFRVRHPQVLVAPATDAWTPTGALGARSTARWSGAAADVTVGVSASDAHAPVDALVHVGRDATVVVRGVATDPAGTWRVAAGSGKERRYVGTRVPRLFAPDEPLPVPGGADLILRFDPAALLDDGEVDEGDEIAFDLEIRAGDDVETCPVRLVVRTVRTPVDVDWWPSH